MTIRYKRQKRKRRWIVDDRTFDKMLNRLMKQDFSVGTDAFRDDLLERCKDMLGTDGSRIDDSDLDMLAAAGDAFSQLSHDPRKS